MKFVSYFESFDLLNLQNKAEIKELIISTREFSRFGNLKLAELNELVSKLNDYDLVFEWDILMTDSVFNKKIELIKSIDLSKFKSIRVQDPGALEFCLENIDLPIQFIAETGNRNILGLSKWISYIDDRLDRIVLSTELPKTKLQEIHDTFKVNTELSVLSDILLFYSPRSLVAPLIDKKDVLSEHDELNILGNSEESPHKGFPIIENRHGTFMFYTKNHCLLDELDGLKEMGLSFARVDSRHFSAEEKQLSFKFLANEVDFSSFKANFSKNLIKSFYRSNRSDVLFPKLKNSRLLKDDKTFIGEVVTVEKGYGIGIKVNGRKKLNLNDQISFKTPEGKVVNSTINRLETWGGTNLESISNGHAVIQFVKGIAPKSIVLS